MKEEMTFKISTDGDIIINEIVSYSPPKGQRIFWIDLSKIEVKGYTFSKKEGDVYIYKRNDVVANFTITLVDES